MARRKTSSHEGNSEPSFEEALADLESIVEAMEHQNLSLEDLVSHYERGSALLKRCESVLDVARQRIEMIALRDEPTESPTKAGGQAGSLTPSDMPDTTDDDDIRLF